MVAEVGPAFLLITLMFSVGFMQTHIILFSTWLKITRSEKAIFTSIDCPTTFYAFSKVIDGYFKNKKPPCDNCKRKAFEKFFCFISDVGGGEVLRGLAKYIFSYKDTVLYYLKETECKH